MNITSEQIDDLEDGQIFVFGSNESGRHGKGAAKTAMQWGAIYGQAAGIQGRTYAIPTVDFNVTNKIPVGKIRMYVDFFFDYAKEHPENSFLVTKIGCGLAGHKEKDIAPLFLNAKNLPNVFLPKDFWRILSSMDNSIVLDED